MKATKATNIQIRLLVEESQPKLEEVKHEKETQIVSK